MATTIGITLLALILVIGAINIGAMLWHDTNGGTHDHDQDSHPAD